MINIYEPLYKEGQQLTESEFSPLQLPDNSHAAWREFWILVSFYRSGAHKNNRSGIFSPKFQLKTKVSAKDFIEFCQSESSSDVCFINPFPQLVYYSYNVWMQGEENHPGIVKCTQDLLDECGIAWDISQTPRHGADVLCYSNFWVGNEKFWEEYVGGVLNPIAKHIEDNPNSPAVQAVMGETWHTDSAPYLPFIIERLFSTFLSIRKDIKASSFKLNNVFSYCLTEHEHVILDTMMPIVDKADASNNFYEDLKGFQKLLCTIGVMQAKEYFSQNAHPHSGKTINKS